MRLIVLNWRIKRCLCEFKQRFLGREPPRRWCLKVSHEANIGYLVELRVGMSIR